jgi:N-acetyl-alpha-D-muramate 1-phosphate uridylyltransferase
MMRPSGAPTPQKAMVFAAGLGKRMRPLTETTPKPLVRVKGRALIDHVLDDLVEAGVEQAIVNVHHLAGAIEAHLSSRERPQIVVSDERALLLDQGGGIKRVLPQLGEEPFFICNTDAFWRDGGAVHLRALAGRWDPQKMDVALLLATTKGSVGVDWDGDFELDSEGRIFQPPGPRAYVYAGVGIIKPQLFEGVEEDVFPLAPYFFAAAKAGRLFGLASEAHWLHVGTIAAIGEAEAVLAG